MWLWLKFGVAMASVLCSALGLSVFLNFAKFEAAYGEMSRSRLLVLAQDLSSSFEAGIALGLGIGELRNFQQLVERVKAEAGEIQSVTVIDQRGEVVVSSSGAKAQRTLPPGRVAAILAMEGDPWSAVDGRDGLVGLPVLNAFRVPAGVIVVAYDSVFRGGATEGRDN